MRRVLIALAAAIFCWLAAPRSAWAQRVLLLRPPAGDATLSEAFNRLRAELILQDFEVAVLEAEGEAPSPAWLEAEAQRAHAFAGISLTRHSRGATADVCIVDRVTGKTSQRRIALSARPEAPRVLAVRAVDLLRSSLRELPPGERPSADVVGVQVEPPSPTIEAWSTPMARWQLRAAGVGLGTPATLGVAFGGSIALLHRLDSRLSLGLVVAGPLIGARYRAANGVASLRQELGLFRAFWNALPSGAWELGPMLGAGAYHLQAHGEVEEPLQARSDGVWSFAGNAGLETALHLTPAVALGASLSALLLTPRPVVAIDLNQQALSQPLLLASLGLGVLF